MTTPANKLTIADIEKLSLIDTPIAKFLNFIRTWPVFPIFILTVFIISGIFAPWVAPYDAENDQLRAVLASPAWYEACEEGQLTNKFQTCNTNGVPLGPQESVYHFLLGADALGRDVISRIVWGARISLQLAGVAIVVGTLFGATLGLTAGYFGGLVDEVIMRVTDIFQAIPYLLFALAVVQVMGQSFLTIMFVLALTCWPGIVRLVRGQTLQVRSFDYIALARVAGASTPRIMIKHLLPAVANTIVVATTLQVGSVILTESILSFLGAGVPPPTPSWGADIASGREYLGSAWWIAFFPGMAIFLTVLSFNFIGDWLRDRWDPRLRQL
jgi:peptide/nickel transport system permease protein